MAQQKTLPTDAGVVNFIESFANSEQKKEDSFELLQLIKETTGFEPKMWGPSIIGFGSYHYKYASGHEGDAPIIGFSPRKTALSLYVYSPCSENDKLLKDLGKFKMGKACIYAKKLDDLNIEVLKKLVKTTTEFIQEKYPENHE